MKNIIRKAAFVACLGIPALVIVAPPVSAGSVCPAGTTSMGNTMVGKWQCAVCAGADGIFLVRF